MVNYLVLGNYRSGGGDGDFRVSEAPRKALRILIVDDDVDMTQSQVWLLELAGHSVQAVNSAEACIDLLATVTPDLILVDLAMPYVNGFELHRRLRSHPACRHAKIVAHSGRGDGPTVHATTDAGFDGHLVKPVTPEAMASFLELMSH